LKLRGRRRLLGALAAAGGAALMPGLPGLPLGFARAQGAPARDPARDEGARREAARDDTGAPDEDHRAWQHGIDLLRVDGRLLLIWGSAGNPPRPKLGGDWPHDIYNAWLKAPAGAGEVAINPQVLVERPEAQEPPSAAINSRGTILITAEDGEDGINQYAGLWDAQLKPLRPYPFTVRKGGHSGHAAALGERFLVTYSEEWVQGGGFRNLGTGMDVHARLIDARGRVGREITLARGQRDGWPLVAASDRNWMVLWQRYGGLRLMSAVVGADGRASAPRQIAEGMAIRYAYDVAYAPVLGSYVVAGSREGRGFVALLGRDGGIQTVQEGLPPIASEARVLVAPGEAGQGEALAVYAMAPRGLAVLRLARGRVSLLKTIEHPHAWDYMGTTGLFTGNGRVLLATLGTQGIKAFGVELGL